MRNSNLKESFILKVFCTLLLPIILFFSGVSIFSIFYSIAYPELKEENSFYDTESFASTYENRIINSVSRIKRLEKTQRYTDTQGEVQIELIYSKKMETDGYTIFYDLGYDVNTNRDYQYLIIDETNKKAYTNVEQSTKTDTVEEIKEVIWSNQLFWVKEGEQVQTNISKLTYEEVKYGNLDEILAKQENEIRIFTGFNKQSPLSSGIIIEEYFYNIFADIYEIFYYCLPIFLIITIILGIYLISSCGHKKGEEGISLDWFDKIPLEIYGFVMLFILFLEGWLIIGAGSLINTNIGDCIYFTSMATYLFLLTGIWAVGSMIKRIKSHTFFKNSIIYRIVAWIKRSFLKMYETFIYDANITFKVAMLFGGFLLISGILVLSFGGGIGVLLLIGFWIWTYTTILKVIKQFNKIKEALKSIYEGKTDIKLQEDELKGLLKELAIYINDIAGGFSNAIEESLKSERLKTELITNVSHDIKTPLTSIINYVDLLKQENIEDEKAKEYIEILDNKSQRLKKLIEDLVEASKASSGNIKLQKEKLDVKELIKQVTGEFSDKFKKKDLEIVLGMPEEEISIVADSRYLYRVIENLYSNVAKYALEGSRVYVDVMNSNMHTIIAIKNISKEQLNISVEELMQRFVRGDQSRNTEGSGLGLSIAQSLTELQGGNFSIFLDGDLFKVVIEF